MCRRGERGIEFSARLTLAEGAGFGFRQVPDSRRPGERLAQIPASEAVRAADLGLLIAVDHRPRDEDPRVLQAALVDAGGEEVWAGAVDDGATVAQPPSLKDSAHIREGCGMEVGSAQRTIFAVQPASATITPLADGVGHPVAM